MTSDFENYNPSSHFRSMMIFICLDRNFLVNQMILLLTYFVSVEKSYKALMKSSQCLLN